MDNLAEQEGYPVTMLKVDDWGVPPYYELVMTASEATVGGAGLVERFLHATRRGYEQAMADPAAAIAALQAASPDLEQAEEEAGLALLIPAWTAGGVPFGTQTAERWRTYARWMSENGLIPADLESPPPGAAISSPTRPHRCRGPRSRRQSPRMPGNALAKLRKRWRRHEASRQHRQRQHRGRVARLALPVSRGSGSRSRW